MSVETVVPFSSEGSGDTNPPLGTPGRGTEGPVGMRSEFIAIVAGESSLRLLADHSPHQSSSRTCGQMPSTMYVLADVGCTMGPVRRHLPQLMPSSSVWTSFLS